MTFKINVPSMILTAEESLLETCTISRKTITGYVLGESTFTTTTQNNIPCGFQNQSSKFSTNDNFPVVEYDAILRVKLTQSVELADEITVRDTLFTVVGIQTGMTVQTVYVKRAVI